MNWILAIASLLADPLASDMVQDTPNGVSAQAVMVLHRFGRCVVDRRDARVREILAMDYRTDAYQTALRDVAIREKACLRGGQLTSAGVLMAGAFAEGLLKRDLEGRGLRDAIAPEDERPVPRDEVEAVAFCVTSTDPNGVQALLATRPTEAAERGAVDALRPALTGCVAKNDTAQMNIPGLRALFALAAYRLTRQGAAGTRES